MRNIVLLVDQYKTIFHSSDSFKEYPIKVCRIFNTDTNEVGGYVESVDNISSIGNSWIDVNAIVYGTSKITDNALVLDDAIIEDSIIEDDAIIKNDALIINNSIISQDVMVFDDAIVDSSNISGNARIYGNSHVVHSSISDFVEVLDNAIIIKSRLSRYVKVCEDVKLEDSSASDFVELSNNVHIKDKTLTQYSYNTYSDLIHSTKSSSLSKKDIHNIIHQLDKTNNITGKWLTENKVLMILLDFIEEPVAYIKYNTHSDMYEFNICIQIDNEHLFNKKFVYSYSYNPNKCIAELLRILKVFYINEQDIGYINSINNAIVPAKYQMF